MSNGIGTKLLTEPNRTLTIYRVLKLNFFYGVGRSYIVLIYYYKIIIQVLDDVYILTLLYKLKIFKYIEQYKQFYEMS